MVTNDDLVNLYRETEIKRNKEVIFNKIYNNLEKEAMKICHYYCNLLLKPYHDYFFEEAMQESKLCLLRCIDNFSNKKNATFSTFYYKCLKNHIYNLYRRKFINLINEVVDDSVLDWIGSNSFTNQAPLDVVIDNKDLKEILSNAINYINFTKPQHKNIFLEYVGFGDKDYCESNFSNLSRKYGLTRMAIKKICDKYFAILKDIINENPEFKNIKIFL